MFRKLLRGIRLRNLRSPNHPVRRQVMVMALSGALEKIGESDSEGEKRRKWAANEKSLTAIGYDEWIEAIALCESS